MVTCDMKREKMSEKVNRLSGFDRKRKEALGKGVEGGVKWEFFVTKLTRLEKSEKNTLMHKQKESKCTNATVNHVSPQFDSVWPACTSN